MKKYLFLLGVLSVLPTKITAQSTASIEIGHNFLSASIEGITEKDGSKRVDTDLVLPTDGLYVSWFPIPSLLVEPRISLSSSSLTDKDDQTSIMKAGSNLGVFVSSNEKRSLYIMASIIGGYYKLKHSAIPWTPVGERDWNTVILSSLGIGAGLRYEIGDLFAFRAEVHLSHNTDVDTSLMGTGSRITSDQILLSFKFGGMIKRKR